jgi:hypothetical protein
LGRPRIIDHDAVLDRFEKGESPKAIAAALGLKGGHTVRCIVDRYSKMEPPDPRAIVFNIKEVIYAAARRR